MNTPFFNCNPTTLNYLNKVPKNVIITFFLHEMYEPDPSSPTLRNLYNVKITQGSMVSGLTVGYQNQGSDIWYDLRTGNIIDYDINTPTSSGWMFIPPSGSLPNQTNYTSTSFEIQESVISQINPQGIKYKLFFMMPIGELSWEYTSISDPGKVQYKHLSNSLATSILTFAYMGVYENTTEAQNKINSDIWDAVLGNVSNWEKFVTNKDLIKYGLQEIYSSKSNYLIGREEVWEVYSNGKGSSKMLNFGYTQLENEYPQVMSTDNNLKPQPFDNAKAWVDIPGETDQYPSQHFPYIGSAIDDINYLNIMVCISGSSYTPKKGEENNQEQES